MSSPLTCNLMASFLVFPTVFGTYRLFCSNKVSKRLFYLEICYLFDMIILIVIESHVLQLREQSWLQFKINFGLCTQPILKLQYLHTNFLNYTSLGPVNITLEFCCTYQITLNRIPCKAITLPWMSWNF